MRRTFILLLLAFVAPAAADEPKVELKDAYLQRVAGAGWVDFDADFNAVFHLETGYYFARTGKFVTYGPDVPPNPAHIDRAGRIWVKDNKTDATHLWNGTKWEKLGFAPLTVFDDSRGRVFVFDGKNVRVLDTEGKWTTQVVSKVAHAGGARFVEDGKRVWFHGWSKNPGFDGTSGAWSYADGKWTHHTDDFPFRAVHRMYPIADGRILLMEYHPPGYHVSPPYFWHPDRKLEKDEWQVLPRGLRFGPREAALGTDGTLYLGVDDNDNSLWMALDPKGKLHELPRNNLRLAQLPTAEVRGQNRVFAKLGDTPPVLLTGEGQFVGADRHGRYYFWHAHDGWRGYSKWSTVLAVQPKHEKPGEILRVEKEKPPVRAIVKDDVGKIWAEPVGSSALLQWHGGKWIDTPIQPLHYPRWTARPAAPWSQWPWRAGPLFQLHGKNGSVLAVRVRDIYQRDEPADGERIPPHALNDPTTPGVPVGKERPTYWLEGFLFRDGKWTGPLEIRKLLADHAAAILADFPVTSGEASFLALANDGTRLWAAFDGKVVTTDKTGKLIEATWPRDKPKAPFPVVMLGRLADGKVFLAGGPNAGDGHSLTLADGKIVAEAFPMPAVTSRPQPLAHWKLAKDGTFWYWAADGAGFGAHVWHFRDGKWVEKKGVGAPLYEDADGNVVCLPEPRPGRQKLQLLVVNGTAIKELNFPRDEWQLGFTSLPKDANAWAMGESMFWLDTSGAKPVLRWRLLTESVFGHVPVVVDAKGTALLGTLRGALEK